MVCPTADFLVLQQQGNRLSGVDNGRALGAALGVGRQHQIQLLGLSEKIDDQPARLVAEDSVHAGDGCISPWARVGLSAYIAWRQGAEFAWPHVADDDDAEWVFGVLEPVLFPCGVCRC